MTASVAALRIKRLSLTDFRAFPGSAPAHFDLDGKNLLVYGENGAGKSSIFHALREFFALKPARRLDDYRNVFSKMAKEQVAISVDFDDGGNEPERALLQKADDLLKLGYVEAAANYVRQAFEMGVRYAAQELRIKMEYRLDPTARKAQDFLDKLKSWQGSANVPRADWKAATDRLELLKNVVMNPYSHPSAPNIPRQEVVDAADAVDRFLELAGKK